MNNFNDGCTRLLREVNGLLIYDQLIDGINKFNDLNLIKIKKKLYLINKYKVSTTATNMLTGFDTIHETPIAYNKFFKLLLIKLHDEEMKDKLYRIQEFTIFRLSLVKNLKQKKQDQQIPRSIASLVFYNLRFSTHIASFV